LACGDGVDHAAVLEAVLATLLELATKLKALTEAGPDQYMEAVTAVEAAESMLYEAYRETHERSREGRDENAYASFNQAYLHEQNKVMDAEDDAANKAAAAAAAEVAAGKGLLRRRGRM
jgi:hypothetical protein